MTLSIHSGLLVGYILAMTRAATWLLVSPPFNSTMVPIRIKAGFAAALALALGPRVAEQSVPLEVGPLIGAIVLQVVAGAALGFVAQLLFAMFQTAGAIVDIFGAFSISQALDPVTGVQTSVFGRFYSLFASVLLFVTGGHLLLVRGFLTSFEALPVDGFRSARVAEILTADVTTFFMGALQIAAPLVAALFLTDVALGLLSRAAPEMNVFLLGLPIKVFVTISLVSIVLPLFPNLVAGVTDDAVRHGLGIGR